MMEWRIVSRVAALAVALPTVAALLYWLFVSNDDDDCEVQDQGRGDVSTSARQTVIQLPIPSRAVGAVIGTRGGNIKKIEEETGTKVSFSERGDATGGDAEERTVFIRGESESAQRAEVLIRQVVADMPVIVSEEITVPAYCLGRLIGRGGETIRSLSRASRCKIFIDRSQDSAGKDRPRVVTLTGGHKDIQTAKALIAEKVMEEEEFRGRTAAKATNGEQPGGATHNPQQATQEVLPSATAEEPPGASWDSGDQCRPLVPCAEPVRETMEVFVSAVEHAGHFWLQMISHEALNLDAMTDDMSVFYSDPNNSQKYRVGEVKAGDVVAAPFSEDNLWYRARVEGFEQGQVDLYYFDFGDNGLVHREAVRELRPEYQKLPVQAIECKLANVRPAGEEWSEESCEVFEALTHCAEWKILSARTVDYLPLPSGQLRPCVHLVDNAVSPTVDVAEQLVSRGLAVWETPPSPTPPPPVVSSAVSSDTVSLDPPT